MHNYFTNYHIPKCFFFFVSLTLFIPSSFFIHYPSFSIPSRFICLILPLPSLQHFFLSSPLFYLSSALPLYNLSTPPLLSYIFSHFLLVLLLLLSLRLPILNLYSFLSLIFFLFSSCSPQTVELQGSLAIGTDFPVTFKYALFGFLEYMKA